jgi:hypothetical protein
MRSRLDEYRRCAEICAQSWETSTRGSIAANNRAVSRMYGLVEAAVAEGPQAVGELVQLLDEPLTVRWIAHQLLERATVSAEVASRCLALIEGWAEDSIGDAYWLRDYYKRQDKRACSEEA